MRRCPWILLAGLVLSDLVSPGAHGAFGFEALDPLPPGEQYRQLSLLSLVAGGADPALLAAFEDGRSPQMGPGAGLQLDDFAKPLARIVDQELLLAGAAGAFRFARENAPAIQDRMTAIARANPVLISLVDVDAIAADAIIIRSAIADSLEYTGSATDAAAAARIRDFRGQTVHLRNMMEYNQFQRELALITDQAIVDLGGRLDAYQRMFEGEVDAAAFRRRIESADIMNRQIEDPYEAGAVRRNDELLMMLILMESQVEHQEEDQAEDQEEDQAEDQEEDQADSQADGQAVSQTE
jgi:hypothetical protein